MLPQGHSELLFISWRVVQLIYRRFSSCPQAKWIHSQVHILYHVARTDMNFVEDVKVFDPMQPMFVSINY
jgi:hypothetical protein